MTRSKPTPSRNRADQGARAALLGLAVNGVLVVAKITAGLLGSSYALVADGVESSLDLFSSLIVWRGTRVAGRDPDERHPFGYGKAEPIAAAMVAFMLLVAALGIAVQAVREIVTPHHAPAPFTLFVLVGVIAVKEVLFRRVLEVGEFLGSSAVRADAWHHRSDAITSAAAFIGISVALLGGPSWAPADDVAALAASGIIVFNGLRLLRPALHDLMDRAPDPAVTRRIVEVAEGVTGVRCVEKVLARSVGTGYRTVLHVQTDAETPLSRAHAIGGEVRQTIVREIPIVEDVVIHMEPYWGEDGEGESGRRPPSPRP